MMNSLKRMVVASVRYWPGVGKLKVGAAVGSILMVLLVFTNANYLPVVLELYSDAVIQTSSAEQEIAEAHRKIAEAAIEIAKASPDQTLNMMSIAHAAATKADDSYRRTQSSANQAQFFIDILKQPNRCEIRLGECARYPNLSNVFLNDKVNGAASDEAACLKRSSEWFTGCGGSGPVRAVFVKDHEVQKSNTYGSCLASTKACPKNPKLAHLTLNFEEDNAGQDANVCMKKLTTLRNSCGAEIDGRFFVSPTRSISLLDREAVTKAIGCRVSLGACAVNGSGDQTFLDTFGEAPRNEQACLNRAREYHDWCGRQEPVTAAFYSNGAFSRAAQVGACMVKVRSCPAAPQFANRSFAETDPQMNSDEERCLSRANEWAKTCQGPDPVVMQYFELGGLVSVRLSDSTSCEVQTSSCPLDKRLNKIIFRSATAKASGDPKVCLAEADSVAKTCGSGQPVTATFFRQGQAALAKTSDLTECRVTVKDCPKQPSSANKTIFDSHKGSAVNPNVCMNRAAEYHSWCGAKQPIEAAYYRNNKREESSVFGQATVAKVVDRTECRVTVKDCPKQPGSANKTIFDSHNGSAANPNACMKRAGEFYSWCGAVQPIEAAYFRNNKREESSIFSQPMASKTSAKTECLVAIKDCPKQPSFANKISPDNLRGSGGDASVCAARASEFYQWCGAKQPVTTTFYRGGVLERSRTYVPESSTLPTATQCRVSIKDCPTHPSFANKVSLDDYRGSGSDVKVCVARAAEFYHWCGAKQPVSTSFFRGGALVQSRTFVPESPTLTPDVTQCRVTIKDCPKQPSFANKISLDNVRGSGSDAKVCAARAAEFHAWCGTKQAVSTSFYRGPKLENQTVFGGPVVAVKTKCEIFVNDCPKNPSRANKTAIDNSRGSSSNAQVCMERAAEHRLWCGGDLPISAVFYRDGVKVQEALTPGNFLGYWPANSSAMHHQLGSAKDLGWETPALGKHAVLSYGPYEKNLPAGKLKAVFELKVDNNSADNSPVAEIDVFQASTNEFLARMTITRAQFEKPFEFQKFELPFRFDGENVLEFRVSVYGNSYVHHAGTTVYRMERLGYWNANDSVSFHRVGKANGTGWDVPAIGRTDVLTYGPYVNGLPAQHLTAVFELTVDNNSADDSPVITLDVNEASSHTMLARKTLTRKDFKKPFKLQQFELPFMHNGKGPLEFRVFVHGNSYVHHANTSVYSGR